MLNSPEATILVNLPHSDRLAYRRLLRGILDEVQRHPIARALVVPCVSDQIRQEILDGRFVAMITEGGYPDGPPGLLGALPMVGIRHPDDLGHLHRVLQDPADIACRVLTHFGDEGVDAFGVFHSMEPDQTEGRTRSQAFLALLQEEGLPGYAFPDGPRSAQKWTMDGQLADLTEWLGELPHPCGIFCGNDDHAYRVLLAARQAGLQVPRDIAVVGYGNDDLFCDSMHPTLSSIAPGWEEVGRECVRHLAAAIRGRPGTELVTWLAGARVVKRGSTDRRFHDFPIVQQAVQLFEADMAAIGSARELANLLHVSHTTLNRQFRAATGASTWAYFRGHRLEHALHLLQTTERTLSDICAEIGIATIAQLSTDIRELTGQSPREIRK